LASERVGLLGNSAGPRSLLAAGGQVGGHLLPNERIGDPSGFCRLCWMAAMKPRHVAALTLVGWYLMVPPPVLHSSLPVDLDAPLSKWRLFSMHKSAAECEQGLVAFYKLVLICSP
jgi:hypothetical protein